MADGGGYIYIDWNGNIQPCVFVPYYVDNIIDLYTQGKNLADAVMSDFMKRGRKWQEEYCHHKNPEFEHFLMPCSIRDHYQNFRENILTPQAKPENIQAEQALNDSEYYNNLINYDNELKELTEKIVKEDFLVI